MKPLKVILHDVFFYLLVPVFSFIGGMFLTVQLDKNILDQTRNNLAEIKHLKEVEPKSENVICREQKVKNFCLCVSHPNISYWTEKCSTMQEAGFLVIYAAKGLPK